LKNIGILGGDLRNIKLVELFAKEEVVYTYGLENNKFSDKNIIQCKSIDEIAQNCKYIVSGIPFSRNDEDVYSSFSSKIIKIKEVLEQLKSRTLIAGAIGEHTLELAKQNDVSIVDLMNNESFVMLNVIPTVEGALQVMMENTEFTIHNSNCLVLGFGRIGKLLCNRLKSLGANVSCMARKDKDLSCMQAFGYKGVHINDLSKNLNNIDIIFNTIPAVMLKDEELKVLENKNTIIIELASSPGGVDLNKAKEYGIKIISAQGLPGKVVPITAARYIKETLEKIII